MTCKGVCEQYRAKKVFGLKRYETGQKRCKNCSMFLNWLGLWCPCCGLRMRTKPRNRKRKKESVV